MLIHALFGPPSANWQHLQQTVLATYITNTLLLMLGVGFLSLLMGVGCAWLTARYTFFGSRLLAPALVLPLAAPAYLTGYVYADLLEYSGPVQSLLKTWSDDLGWQMGLPSVRSLPGAAMVFDIGVDAIHICIEGLLCAARQLCRLLFRQSVKTERE